MATKTVTTAVEHSNGNMPSAPPVPHVARKLEGFQRKYLQKLVADFERAKEQVQAIQASANDFALACAEDNGITLGQNGWHFDFDKMEFFQARIEGVADGDDSRP